MAPRLMAVVGARPNFMKVAPIWRELDKGNLFSRVLVHTGQHYDENMSKVFFEDLSLPEPDVYLGVGSGSHAEQTGRIMIAFEKTLVEKGADLVMVVGDVNSTMACALVAVKLGVPVAHVEAGLRSFDRTMPEEINRMVTDMVAEILFTTCRDAEKNLVREGVDKDKIHFVGNVMIDSLFYYSSLAEGSRVLRDLGLKEGEYGLVTLHRPSNVDNPPILAGILEALDYLGSMCPLVFPVHPRTFKVIRGVSHAYHPDHLRIVDPLGYLDFLKLMKHARLVLTDSGGIQEETTVLGIPCLTIRRNTERPITLEQGTNVLVGVEKERIIEEGTTILEGNAKKGRIPELWDGRASERIVEVLQRFFS